MHPLLQCSKFLPLQLLLCFVKRSKPPHQLSVTFSVVCDALAMNKQLKGSSALHLEQPDTMRRTGAQHCSSAESPIARMVA